MILFIGKEGCCQNNHLVGSCTKVDFFLQTYNKGSTLVTVTIGIPAIWNMVILNCSAFVLGIDGLCTE